MIYQVDIFVDGQVLHNLDVEMDYSDEWLGLPQYLIAVNKFGIDRVAVTVRDNKGNQI